MSNRDPRLLPRTAGGDEALEHAAAIVPVVDRGLIRVRVIARPALAYHADAWTLVEHRHRDAFTVRHVRWDRQQPEVQAFGETWQGGLEYEVGPAFAVHDRVPPRDEARQILDALGAIRLPLGFEPPLGTDGLTNTVLIGQLFSTARFDFWCDGPNEWRELAAWTERFKRWAV